MAAIRHSRIELTMNYYTDPVLLDVAGAVEALPDSRQPTSSQLNALVRTGVVSLWHLRLRRSDIRLTMNIHTHLDLADTASAVAALPAI
jgi:hypothetical protein